MVQKIIKKYIDILLILKITHYTTNKKPTNVGLNVVERVNLFSHSLALPHNLQYKMDMGDKIGYWKC